MKQRFVITFLGALVAITGCTAAGARPTLVAAHKPAVRAALALDLEFGGSTLPSQLTSGWYGDGKSVTKPVNGAETACYSPNNVSVAGGYLDLRLTNQSCTVNGRTYPMTTGSVSTLNKFSFTNGTLKARVFIDGDSQGVWDWPAFWTDGLGQWPNTGESDIAEGLSGKVCYHVHTPSGGPGGCPAGNYVGWHVFKETVKNGLTTYFYDGKQVGQEQDVAAPQFIDLGMQAGTYGGKVIAPADMLVDWIKVRSSS